METMKREGKDRKCEKEVRDMGDRTRSKMHVGGEPERDVMAKVIFVNPNLFPKVQMGITNFVSFPSE